MRSERFAVIVRGRVFIDQYEYQDFLALKGIIRSVWQIAQEAADPRNRDVTAEIYLEPLASSVMNANPTHSRADGQRFATPYDARGHERMTRVDACRARVNQSNVHRTVEQSQEAVINTLQP
jgi:hypothetical protein